MAKAIDECGRNTDVSLGLSLRLAMSRQAQYGGVVRIEHAGKKWRLEVFRKRFPELYRRALREMCES